MNHVPPYISQEAIALTLELACAIQAIPAPTFHEEPRAQYFFQQMRELGLEDVQRDRIGNVLARLPGAKPGQNRRPLVVSAHMDTVHPLGTALTVQHVGDRIVGPGIGDNALGAAALLALVHLLKQQPAPLPGDLWLAFNVGEEGLGDLRGIQALVERFQGQPLAYLVIEGMGLGTILHRGLGVERYKISVQTPGGHSWVDYGAPSAIHELCAIVNRLAGLHLPHDPCTTLNVGVIHGGTSVNTIASHAWLEIDLRSEDGGTLTQLAHNVERTARSLGRNGVRVQMERIGKRQAGMIAETHPLVLMARGVLQELGLDVRMDIASTDANYPLSLGYPSICIGITNGNNAHTQEEYILTPPVGLGLAQLYQLVTQAWDRL